MDKKEAYFFCKFLEIERKKIDEDKYFRGIEINNDPGQEYVIDWINRNAKKWRDDWDISLCKHCNHWRVCGHKIQQQCEKFEFDSNENSFDLSASGGKK
jgi:hypothetical protein